MFLAGRGRRLGRDGPPRSRKNVPKPWLKQQWVIPPQTNAEFVCAMETVFDVYARPYDPKRPVVCVDEGGQQVIGGTRPPLPVRPQFLAEEDYEYARTGTADLLRAFEPRAGTRHVEATERTTKADFPRSLRRIADEWHPGADRITLGWTTCRLTSRPPCTRRSTRPRRSGWRGSSSGTTRRST